MIFEICLKPNPSLRKVKASILQAAWQLVEKEGWQSLSIRKIAEAIEYSSPVIYDHFANKEAILLEFTKRGFQQLNEQLVKAQEQFAQQIAIFRILRLLLRI